MIATPLPPFNKRAELQEYASESISSFAFKGTQKRCGFSQPEKVAILTCYKNICGVFRTKTSHTRYGDVRNLFYIF